MLAVGAAIGVIANLGGAMDTLKGYAVFIQKHLNLPETDLISYLLISLALLFFAILVLLVKKMFNPRNREMPLRDTSTSRATYLRWIRKDVDNRILSSVHHACYLDLKLTEASDMVSLGTFQYQARADETERFFDSFDLVTSQHPFSILLLGAPGSGKTTTLLDYLQKTVTEAEQNPDAPIPVLVNLSKWRRNKGVISLIQNPFRKRSREMERPELSNLDFDEWIIDTISSMRGTGLTKAVVRTWLENHKMIFLLDGLDEAEESFRAVIIEKINAFLERNRNTSIIICSRLADYDALVTSGIKLWMDAAVTIQPLKPQQVSEYLAATRAQELQSFIDSDKELTEMVKSPLDLSIIVLAYRYTDLAKVISNQTHSITAKRVALFDAYVKAMYQRNQLRQAGDPLMPESNVLRPQVPLSEKKLSEFYKYLGWIARLMSERSMSSFSLNRLYDYLLESRTNEMQRFGKIADTGILAILLLLLGIFYRHLYPVPGLLVIATFILIAYPLAIPGDEPPEKKTDSRRPYIIAWPIAIIVVSLLYLFFSHGPYLPWVFGALIVLIFVSIYYMSFWAEAGHSFLAKCLPPLLAILPPVIIYLMGIRPEFRWIFTYSLVVLVSVGLSGGILEENRKPGKIVLILAISAYVLLAAIAGTTLARFSPGLVILATVEVALAISLLTFRTDRQNMSLGIFCGFLAGAFSGLIFTPVFMLLTSTGLSIIFANYPPPVEKILMPIGSMIQLFFLQLKKRLPFNTRHLLRESARMLLLKRTTVDYEFIHRRLRDYFAIRELTPKLNTRGGEQLLAVREVCKLKDASCDVLLEMVNDNDKPIRMACLEGLGEIGSGLAAKALLEVIKNTTGELNTAAISQLHRIKDVAAFPALVHILNTEPISSELFLSALLSLNGEMNRLYEWDNIAKMEECLKADSSIQKPVRMALFRRALTHPDSVKDIGTIITQISSTGLREEKEVTTLIHAFSSDVLEKCLANPVIRPMAFKEMRKRNIESAVLALLRLPDLTDKALHIPYFKRTEVRTLLNKILDSHSDLFPSALFFAVKNNISIRLHLYEAYERLAKAEKLTFITLLGQQKRKKHIRFLLHLLHSSDPYLQKAAILQLNGYESKQIAAGCIEFLKKDPYDPQAEDIMKLLTQQPYNISEAFLLETLNSGSPLRFQAIRGLGSMKSKKAIPHLVKEFEAGYSLYTGDLIDTLVALEVPEIAPRLVVLFEEAPDLKSRIVSALVRFKTNKEILAVYEIIKNKGYRDHILYVTLAMYFLFEKETALIPEIISITPYSRKSVTDKFSSDNIDAEYLFRYPKTFGPMLSHSFFSSDLRRIHEKAESVKKEFDKTGLANGGYPLESFFLVLDNSATVYSVFCWTYIYDLGLTRDLMQSYFEKEKNIGAALTELIAKVADGHKAFLIALAGTHRLGEAAPCIRQYLDHSDEALRSVSIRALGLLRDYNSMELISANLHKTEGGILESSVEALNNFLEWGSRKITGLSQLVYDNGALRSLLLTSRYPNLLSQLQPSELESMVENDDPDIRYSAAVYSGLLGYGSMTERLSLLLHDYKTITVNNPSAHTTVSQGALFALKEIGTPSAKACIDKWQNELMP